MNSNWSYSPETPNLGQIWRFLEPCDLEIWRMTLKNNRAPLLSNIKLYASFHHHMRIQTGVTVRKRLSWVVTSVTSTFDLWPWPFAWTLLLSLVITPENFMMIRWGEHSQKGVTDGRTDGQTDRRTDGRKIPFVELLGRSYKHTIHTFSTCSILCVRILDWIGLDLFNHDTRPSGHISRPTQVNVSQSCFDSLNNYSSLIIL